VIYVISSAQDYLSPIPQYLYVIPKDDQATSKRKDACTEAQRVAQSYYLLTTITGALIILLISSAGEAFVLPEQGRRQPKIPCTLYWLQQDRAVLFSLPGHCFHSFTARNDFRAYGKWRGEFIVSSGITRQNQAQVYPLQRKTDDFRYVVSRIFEKTGLFVDRVFETRTLESILHHRWFADQPGRSRDRAAVAKSHADSFLSRHESWIGEGNPGPL
jgi:hypothetical protein